MEPSGSTWPRGAGARARSPEHGMALALALIALLVIGALVSGAVFVGLAEQRLGRNTVKLQQAFFAAEGGAQLAVAKWTPGYGELAVGDSATFTGSLDDGTGWYRGSVRRLSRRLFLVRAEGFAADHGARQHVGLLVRLEAPTGDLAGTYRADSEAVTSQSGRALLGGRTGTGLAIVLPERGWVNLY